MSLFATIIAFLAEHVDLLEDVYDFLKSGGDKAVLKKAIRDAKVAASDAVVKEELGLDP